VWGSKIDGLMRCEVETIPLAVSRVFDGLTVVGPGSRDRAGFHRGRNLADHPLVLLVPGHRPETVLRRERKRRGRNDGEPEDPSTPSFHAIDSVRDAVQDVVHTELVGFI